MAAAVQTDKFLINSLVLSCLALAHRFPPARWKIFGQCEHHRTKNLHVMMITKTVVMLVMKTMVMSITKTMVMTITKTMVMTITKTMVITAGRGKSPGGLFKGADNRRSFSVSYSPIRWNIIIIIIYNYYHSFKHWRIINSHTHPSAEISPSLLFIIIIIILSIEG